MDLRSPLGKVKGLGSAHNGTHHWLMQRITAVALIPLVIWFVCLVIQASVSADQLLDYLKRPFHAVAMILFLGTILYHGSLGMRVILEDYVSCKCARMFLIVSVQFVTVITAVAAILSVANLHMGTAHSGFGTSGYHGDCPERHGKKGYCPKKDAENNGTIDNPKYQEDRELKQQLYKKLKEKN